MPHYECVAGVAATDSTYAYLAVRPPLPPFIISELENDLTNPQNSVIQFSMTELPDVPNTTELELRRANAIRGERLNIVVNSLSAIMRTHFGKDKEHGFDILSTSVAVDGSEPLFEQYEARRNDTVQAS